MSFEDEFLPTDFPFKCLSNVELSVTNEAGPLGELPAADVALKPPHAAVNQGVVLQIACVAERLPAVAADVRLLSGVEGHVLPEIAHRGEGFTARAAGRRLSRLFPRVDPQVVLERAAVRAALAAGPTDVHLLPGVFEHVVLERALVAHLFHADVAAEQFLRSRVAPDVAANAASVGLFAAVSPQEVDSSVSDQRRGRQERLATHFTNEVPASGVEILVIGQTSSALKRLRTDAAGERPVQSGATVSLEEEHALELPLAQRAHIRDTVPLRRRVAPHVPVKSGLVGEPDPTFGAAVGLFPGVFPGVGDHQAQGGETLGALRTTVRFLCASGCASPSGTSW